MKINSRHNTYIVGCDCKYHHRTDEVEILWNPAEFPRHLVGEVKFMCPNTGNQQAGLVYRGG